MPEAQGGPGKTFMESHDAASLTTICDGVASELFDAELMRVLENAMDPNTPHKGKRSIILTVAVTPNEARNTVAITMTCTSKLAGSHGIDGMVFIGKTRHGKIQSAVHRLDQGELFQEEVITPTVVAGGAAQVPPPSQARAAQ